MKKNVFYFGGVLLFAIALYSCSSDSDDDPNLNNGGGEVTYATNVKAIIDGNCLGCHGSPTANGAPMSLVNYTQVKEAVQNRNLIGRIENGTMPPVGTLTSAQIQIIKNWQSGGFKQ